MLWSLFALLTGGAVFAILWPLARPAQRGATAPDVAFYQAKLEEIARDQARANLAPEEAALAKTEAARQLLAVSGKDPQMTEGAAASPLWHRRLAAVAALVFVPAVAIGFSPGICASISASRNGMAEFCARQIAAKAASAPSTAIAIMPRCCNISTRISRLAA